MPSKYFGDHEQQKEARVQAQALEKDKYLDLIAELTDIAEQYESDIRDVFTDLILSWPVALKKYIPKLPWSDRLKHVNRRITKLRGFPKKMDLQSGGIEFRSLGGDVEQYFVLVRDGYHPVYPAITWALEDRGGPVSVTLYFNREKEATIFVVFRQFLGVSDSGQGLDEHYYYLDKISDTLNEKTGLGCLTARLAITGQLDTVHFVGAKK